MRPCVGRSSCRNSWLSPPPSERHTGKPTPVTVPVPGAGENFKFRPLRFPFCGRWRHFPQERFKIFDRISSNFKTGRALTGDRPPSASFDVFMCWKPRTERKISLQSRGLTHFALSPRKNLYIYLQFWCPRHLHLRHLSNRFIDHYSRGNFSTLGRRSPSLICILRQRKKKFNGLFVSRAVKKCLRVNEEDDRNLGNKLSPPAKGFPFGPSTRYRKDYLFRRVNFPELPPPLLLAHNHITNSCTIIHSENINAERERLITALWECTSNKQKKCLRMPGWNSSGSPVSLSGAFFNRNEALKNL